jgi:hypothetical protein
MLEIDKIRIKYNKEVVTKMIFEIQNWELQQHFWKNSRLSMEKPLDLYEMIDFFAEKYSINIIDPTIEEKRILQPLVGENRNIEYYYNGEKIK